MRQRTGQKRAKTGTTSMGVQYDLGGGGTPRRRNMPRVARRLSVRRRKQLRSAALSVLVIACAAAFSALIGDALWPSAPVAAPVAATAPASPTPLPSAEIVPAETTSAPAASDAAQALPSGAADTFVWISSSGSRYHANAACSNMRSPRQAPLHEAVGLGLTPCQRCKPPT